MKVSNKLNNTMRTALAGIFTSIVLSGSLHIDAHAMTMGDVSNTGIKQESQSETKKPKYVYTEFGEMLNTRKCVDEKEVIEATETACSMKEYKFVTPELLESIAYQESRFVATAQNGTAVTMYQIKPQFYQDQLKSAGITEEDLDDVTNQSMFAAEVVEYLATNWSEKGLSDEDAVKAAVTSYHLVTESAEKRVANRNWDEYTVSVMDRASLIKESKGLDYMNVSKIGKEIKVNKDKDNSLEM